MFLPPLLLCFQGLAFPGRWQSKYDNGYNGSIQEVFTDMEVMGITKFRFKWKSYILSQLLPSALQASLSKYPFHSN